MRTETPLPAKRAWVWGRVLICLALTGLLTGGIGIAGDRAFSSSRPASTDAESLDPVPSPIEPGPEVDPTPIPSEDPGGNPEEQSPGEGPAEGNQERNETPPEAQPLEKSNLALSEVQPGGLVGAASWAERPATRLDGADRYEVAAAIVRHAYPTTADTVIVAMGDAFADSLSAAPLSAKLRAPLLPVGQSVIPDAIKVELARLKPTKIIIAGGPGSVSPLVESNLKQYAASITRISGEDRYSTSIEIVRFGWPSGAADVFLASGEGFADALSAGAAAAKRGGPVLLVQGSAASLGVGSAAELNRLGATRTYVVGGPASVSAGIESSLGVPGRSVIRYSGQDRYEVSANVTDATFSGAADVYWANGLAFADALAGAAVAGARGAALLLVRAECVPSPSYSATDRLIPGEILILGGSGSLHNSVRDGNECMSRAAGMSDSDWAGAQELYAKLNQDRFERGLGGLRVSDSTRGTPAQGWAVRLAGGKAENNQSLSAAEPWVRYQLSSVTRASSNRVQRSFDLLRSHQGASRWLYQPNAGARGFVSVGYATAAGQSAAVLFLGAGAAG